MEWAEEVTFGNMFEGLKSSRYDAICTPTWPDGHTARAAEFSTSWFYAGIIPVVRANETRFTSNLDFNHPDVRIVVQEGNSLQTLANTLFPQAKKVVLSPSADANEMEQLLLSNKADVMFGDMNRYYQFNTANPGKIKALDLPPVQLNPFKMAVAKGEHTLSTFLSENIEALIHNGTMKQIILKQQPMPKTFLPTAQPYSDIN
jgi:ABC-type amino acid transport substrate-binding protein